MEITREIDKRAQDNFNMWLPPGWLIRKQDPDIHIDYFVETTSGSEPSGLVFGVQLKGTKRLSLSKSYIKHSLKTKHLKYYLDKVKQPVFLILIDVCKKEGFWLFLQRWAKEELLNEIWRDQSKITIRIPMVNSLDDFKRFHAQIIDADTFMRELWPSSIISAVQHEKASLEQLDPRIGIDISLKDMRTHYTIFPKETFQLDFQFRNSPNLRKRISELIDLGINMTIGMDEILEISGSPLLEKIFKEAEGGKLEIRSGVVLNPNLTLSTWNSNQSKYILYGITGEMSGGKKGIKFEGGLPKSPLKVGLFIHEELAGLKIKVTLAVDFTPWENCPILHLAFFEKIKTFLELLQENQCVEIDCEVDGNSLFSAKGSFSESIRMDFSQVLEYLNFIGKLRFIAKAVRINPKFPVGGVISIEEENTVCLLYELAHGREFRQEGYSNRGTMCLEGTAENSANIIQKLIGSNNGELAFEETGRRFHLLGESFEFAPLRHTITNVKINFKKFTELVSKNNTEISSANIEWESGVQSVRIISKL